jgi:hypothetical protein
MQMILLVQYISVDLKMHLEKWHLLRFERLSGWETQYGQLLHKRIGLKKHDTC